jgi:lipopolysaccharide export system permease protein
VILSRHIASRALLAFAAAILAVVAIFLLVDFAENAQYFKGEGWLGEVVRLYAWKALAVGYQIAPAAMLLAAGITGSALQKSREYVAMRALGLGPRQVAFPVLAAAATVAALLAVFNDAVAVDASARAEEIMATRFHRWGTWSTWHAEKRWFRGKAGRRIYNLRGGEGGAFGPVTILEVDEAFRLQRRVDATRMTPAGNDAWLLSDGTERTFRAALDAADEVPEQASYEAFPEKTYRFEEPPGAFAVRAGRPSQMRRGVLGEQIGLRRTLGLPVVDYELEWQGKLAFPLAAIPASLMALALALRRERKGHLTAALFEAVCVSAAFWGIQGLFGSLGRSGLLPPAAAAWAPDLAFLAAGAWALRRFA